MKKNIIFDKNLQLQNGIDVNTINSQTITVETVSQTGNLLVDGSLTVLSNLDINGTTLNTSSNELNVNKTINTSGSLICNGITNNSATSSNTLLGEYNFLDQVNLNGSSYGVTQNYTNNTNLLATTSFVKSQFVNDISFTGNVNIGKYVTASLYNGSSGPFNIQTNTLGTPIYTNGMDGTGANTGLQVGWNHTALYGETDLLNWAQAGYGGFNFYSISSGFPIKLVASLSINGTSYISDNLGVKNQTPAYDLDVSGNINFTGNIYQNGNIFSGGGSSNNVTGNVDISGGNLTVSGNVTATSFNATSDRRIKDNILSIDREVIVNILPRKYINKLTNKPEFGLIADEIQEIYPQIVNGNKDSLEFQSVNYIQLIPLLIKEVQELKNIIKKLNI